MGTKEKPGRFDCYSNAEPDEPMFVLLARDPQAPTTVRAWAALSKGSHDQAKLDEALSCADAMERWRNGRRGGPQ